MSLMSQVLPTVTWRSEDRQASQMMFEASGSFEYSQAD